DIYGEFAERYRRLIMDNKARSDEDNKKIYDRIEENYLHRFRGRVVVEKTVRAEPERARELVQAQTRTALNLLRYAVLVLGNSTRPAFIGIMGEAVDDMRHTLVMRGCPGRS